MTLKEIQSEIEYNHTLTIPVDILRFTLTDAEYAVLREDINKQYYTSKPEVIAHFTAPSTWPKNVHCHLEVLGQKIAIYKKV